jgi:microsomal dipeptidase-like Zn-dependent dipeptidase
MSNRKKRMMRKGWYHPWTVIISNFKKIAAGKRASGYSQCDFVQLWNSDTRLVFNALYPLEKGFMKSDAGPSGGSKQFLKRIMGRLLHDSTFRRDIAQGIYMNLPQKLVNKFQSDEYDYWEALQEEYEFVISRNNLETESNLLSGGFFRTIFQNEKRNRDKHPEYYKATGTFRIPKDREELKECINNGVITTILTIEGAHSLGTDTASPAAVLERIDHIKKNWDYPLFFITFAHHFNNFLCGHAHSLPDTARLLLNQDDGRDVGFNNDGLAVLRKFLAIDEKNDPKKADGHRVLIDVKHMNAKSRKQYYKIVDACMKKGENIPVIASHCGYAGVKSLDDFIVNEPNENDSTFDESGRFYAWNINLCDEDIKMVHKTHGLIGISFDQRVLGVPMGKIDKGMKSELKTVWENIKEMLNVICEDDELSDAEKKQAWDIFSIGTDYDGYIDPIDPYPTALNFRNFRKDLLDIIQKEMDENSDTACLKVLDDKLTPMIAVDKICWRNARDFVLENYPE